MTQKYFEWVLIILGTTKEAEQKRVDKELAKIRTKFKTSGNLKGYDRKKYISKLLYIYMLGYDIDFGHIEAVNLLSAEKYSEKHTVRRQYKNYVAHFFYNLGIPCMYAFIE